LSVVVDLINGATLDYEEARSHAALPRCKSLPAKPSGVLAPTTAADGATVAPAEALLEGDAELMQPEPAARRLAGQVSCQQCSITVKASVHFSKVYMRWVPRPKVSEARLLNMLYSNIIQGLPGKSKSRSHSVIHTRFDTRQVWLTLTDLLRPVWAHVPFANGTVPFALVMPSTPFAPSAQVSVPFARTVRTFRETWRSLEKFERPRSCKQTGSHISPVWRLVLSAV
jgi:hypothetical protein